MSRIFHTGLLFLCFIVCTALYCQAQFTFDAPFNLKAKLINSKTNEKIQFANIVNTKTMIGAISDSSGVFIIPVKQGEVLQITSIGYQTRFFTVNDSLKRYFNLPRIKMFEKIYEIGNVDIRYFGTYEQFKYRVIHSRTEDPLKNVNRKLRKTIDSIARLPTNDLPTFSLGSPVTALYMAFSKEGKELRKLKDALEKAPAKKTMDDKFNRKILENATGLKDKELDEFALFCKLPEDFVLKATDYELHERILEYFERFKKRDKDTIPKNNQ